MAATTTAPQTSLQRTGKFTLTAMIVAKGTPSNWVKQTVLLRLVEQSGAETMLTATNEAFKNMRRVGEMANLRVPTQRNVCEAKHPVLALWCPEFA